MSGRTDINRQASLIDDLVEYPNLPLPLRDGELLGELLVDEPRRENVLAAVLHEGVELRHGAGGLWIRLTELRNERSLALGLQLFRNSEKINRTTLLQSSR